MIIPDEAGVKSVVWNNGCILLQHFIDLGNTDHFTADEQETNREYNSYQNFIDYQLYNEENHNNFAYFPRN